MQATVDQICSLRTTPATSSVPILCLTCECVPLFLFPSFMSFLRRRVMVQYYIIEPDSTDTLDLEVEDDHARCNIVLVGTPMSSAQMTQLTSYSQKYQVGQRHLITSSSFVRIKLLRRQLIDDTLRRSEYWTCPLPAATGNDDVQCLALSWGSGPDISR